MAVVGHLTVMLRGRGVGAAEELGECLLGKGDVQELCSSDRVCGPSHLTLGQFDFGR